mgnify:FL=1|tara:strand:+ start:291 stop:659 length:369 start_codon:yes stop_codon:yes gene_type:complete
MVLEMFVAKYLLNKKNEKFENNNSNKWGDNKDDIDKVKSVGTFAIVLWIIGFIFTIPFMIGACYFSWTSNTLIEWGNGFKILFAFFAFLAPISYLVTHLIHKYDLVIYVEKQKVLHNIGNIY